MTVRKEIEQVLNDEYGVGIVVASEVVVLWAAEKTSDPEAAVAAANAVKRRYGRAPVYIPYGYFQ